MAFHVSRSLAERLLRCQDHRLTCLSDAPARTLFHKGGMGVTGLERRSVTDCQDNNLRESTPAGAANSGALGASDGPEPPPVHGLDDADLRAIVEAWPGLPAGVRADVLVIVRRAMEQRP